MPSNHEFFSNSLAICAGDNCFPLTLLRATGDAPALSNATTISVSSNSTAKPNGVYSNHGADHDCSTHTLVQCSPFTMDNPPSYILRLGRESEKKQTKRNKHPLTHTNRVRAVSFVQYSTNTSQITILYCPSQGCVGALRLRVRPLFPHIQLCAPQTFHIPSLYPIHPLWTR